MTVVSTGRIVEQTLAMADHEELIHEIKTLETLSPQERLDYARKRRMLQLQRFNRQEEKERMHPPLAKANRGKPARFQPNISLIEAAARNDREEVLSLLGQGITPDLQNDDGLSALHQAVIEDCMDVVQALIENKANANIQDDDLWTPLHAAVACGNLDIVVYLVSHGADLVLLNADGNMPIDLVEDFEDIERYLDEAMTRSGYTEDELEALRNVVADQMLEDLEDSLAKGRSLNVKNDHGATAMHIAASYGYEDVVEFLLDHGAKIDENDTDGWQPIHAAACWGHDTIIETLVNHGADLDARTRAGETPMDLTEDEDLREILVELKESGKKTKEIKRTQSNSSRTLCVRRSSLVQKHEFSSNDAKQEGMYRQTTEFLRVYIDPDNSEDAAVDANGIDVDLEGDTVTFQGKGNGSPTAKTPVSPATKPTPQKDAIQHISNNKHADTPTPPKNGNGMQDTAAIVVNSNTIPPSNKRKAPLPPNHAPIAQRESESPASVKSTSVWEKVHDQHQDDPSPARTTQPAADEQQQTNNQRNMHPPPTTSDDTAGTVVIAAKNTAEVKRRSRRRSIKKTCCQLM